jgi:Ca-activated chloride channel family protein
MPARLGDLYAGESLVILGQYRGETPLRFALRGKDRGSERAFGFEFDLGKATTRNAFVPRLWAARRVAELVDQVRQAGALTGQPGLANADPFARPELRELREEILRLSAEFGVLTEYTAFLATEGTQLGDWKALNDACGANLHHKAWSTRSGIGAFNQAYNLKGWGKEQTALNPRNCWLDDKLERVETANVQQVCDRAFFKRGAQWIDGSLIPAGNLQPSRTVLWGSPEHDQLVERLSREGRQGMLSLKGEIVLRLDGEVIVVRNP